MSYISDFLKELEKLNKTTVSKVQNTQKKGQIAAGMQSKDQFTSDFFKELHKLEEEEALKKNQEKKKTRFDDPIKTRFNAEDELTTAGQKRKESKTNSTVGGGGRSFSSGSGSFAEDEEEKKEKLRTEFIKNSLLNSPFNSGAMSLPSIKEKYTADTSGSEEEKNSKTNSSSLYVPIGGGYKLNKKTLSLLTSDNEIIGKYDAKTGIIKSKDGTNYFRIKEDGSIRLYDGASELGFDTSGASDSWFQAGAFEDGYQFGDLSKSVVATGRELGKGVVSGALNLGEALVDTGAYLGGLVGKGVGWLSGADDVRMQGWDNMIGDFIAKDIVNEDAIADVLVPDMVGKFTEYDSDEAALIGKKATGLAESAGNLLVQAGLSYVGVPWWLTSGVTSFGGEAENAFKQDATYGEAGFSAGVSALGEVATEKIFGAFKFQGKGLDDGLKTAISRNIQNKTLRTIATLSLDSLGEGGEEWLSGKISAAGQKLSYATDKEIRELFTKEDAWDAFIGGAILGGGSNVTNIVKAKINGVDSVTGLTKNEQAVVDKVYKDEVAEAEKDGKKLSGTEKNKLYDRIRNDLEKGYISTDTIEEVLGDDTYKQYKDAIDSENAALKEFEGLYEGDELEQQKKSFQEHSKLDSIREQLGNEVAEKVKGDRLIESYNEKIRRKQLFTADLTKYSEKSQAVVQKAIDSGVLNNTNRSHELVDLVAKIAGDKGIDFDFTNNEKLKESGFAVEGSTINGFRSENGVTLNVQSKKALNSVVGHEITHVLEGTQLYGELQKIAFEYAEMKGEYKDRLRTANETYKNVEGYQGVDGYNKIKSEVLADIVGDYLFTDADFVKNLSANHRNVFQKIYDEIKYLYKVATAGSKEFRELEKLKKVFEDNYRNTNVSSDASANTQYSLSADSDGKKLSKGQQEFFKDSKMVDADGKLKIMYHGTQKGGFHVFDPKYSDDDTSLFFVDRNDVAMSYSGTSETYSARTFRTADDFNSFFNEIGTPEYEVQEQDGKFYLYDDGDLAAVSESGEEIYEEFRDLSGLGYGDVNYKVYLNLTNPLVVDAKGANWDEIKIPKEHLAKFNESIYQTDDPYGYIDNAPTRSFAEYAKAQGYDGVIFNNLHDNGGFSNGSEGASTVAIAFESDQVKSVANTEPTKHDDIRYSLSSIANSFFGDENMSAYEFQKADYTETQGYKDYVEQCLNNYKQSRQDFNADEAQKSIENSIAGIIRVAVAAKKAGYDIYDDATKRSKRDSKKRLLFSSLEPNSEYTTSNDISTICDKRKNFAEIYDDIVKAEEAKGVPVGKRFFDNVDNYFYIHKLMADKGLTQPCRECYVESMRKNLAPMASAFLRLVRETNPNNTANDQLYHQKGKTKGGLKVNNYATRSWVLDKLAEYDMTANDLTIETLTTAAGLAQLKIQAPLVYEAFNSFYGQSKPKMPRAATPFRFGELTALLTDEHGKIKQSVVDKINSTGGFRLQSYSDFQIQNYTDVLQALFEAGTLGLRGHAYTKVPAFLDATEGTNLKRNISIFMYKDGNEWKLDRNDSFPYALEEIYDIVDADKTGNTGIIAVSQNDDMSAWIMANDHIGYGIPFHKSGLKMGTVRDTVVKTEDGREVKGYTGTKDHTKQQTEVWAKSSADHKALTKVKKGINIYSFWDFDNSSNLSKNELIEKNVKAYIDACEDAGYLPKFRDYVMNNSKVLNSVLSYSKQLGFVGQDATVDDISFKYKGYTIPYGYYKFLGDFGMFTPDGKASPQEVLSLDNYDFDKAVDFFANSEELRRNEILQQFSNGKERRMYRESDMTAEQLTEIVKQKRREIAEGVASGELAPTKHSLSADGEAQKTYGNYNIRSEDVAFETAPAQNDIAPTAETVTQEATQENLFPDDLAPAQNELATLQRQVEQYEDRMIEAVNAGDYSKFNRLNAEYEPIRKRYDQLKAEDDAEFNERMSSLTDEDAPPDIAPDYVQTADNIPITKKLVDDIAREVRSSLALSNKDMADVRSIISEFSAQETPSRDDLFHELRDRFGTYSETQTDDTLAEAKSVLRSFKISVDDFIKSEIADYGDLVKRNFGKVRFSKEGTSVDSAYEELASQYPHLFPEDIISPTDQLMQIIDVANMDTSLVSEQRIDDESILGVADTIIDRLSAYKNTQREKTANKLGREAFDSLLEDDSAVPPVDLDGILRNKSLAERRSGTSGDIAPTSEIYDTQHKKGVVEGQQAMWNDPVPEKVTRKALHERIIDNMKNTFHVNGFELDDILKNAKNLSTFATVDNTPQRVMEKALGYKAGGVLADMTVNKVAQNETEGIKWLNSFTDRKSGLLAKISKQYNIKPGSKQSAAAQMYAEGFYVGENNEIIRYGDAELAQDFPDKQVQKNIKGLARDPRIRQIYDDTLVMINESRKRNAYPEIPRLDNYFLHFREMEDFFSKFGLPFNPNDMRSKDLPTDLNGMTVDLKPGQPYFSSAMHREGKRTSFDLLGGLEKYLNSAKNQIYHIDDIQTLRALRNYIADTYGQAKGLENLDELSDEEAQEKIDRVYDSHLSTFAKFLNEEANVLAGKTPLSDRGFEGKFGRKGLAFMNSLNQQVGKNMVGWNISSSLTNFMPVVQTFAKTNKGAFIKAFAQTTSNKVSSIFGKNDGFAENSPVIIRRKGVESFYRTPWQKVSDPGYILMSAVDNISTELIARTKYNELTKKGMDSQKAHIETDKWVSRLMGDRSLGQQPQLYNSKVFGLVTKFQLEVRNQLDSMFYDTIQEAKVSNEEIQNKLARNAKTAAKVTSTFVQLAVAQHLFGKAFESVAGYNPAFDIIDVIIKTFGWDDEEEDEDTVLDNIEEGFLALLEDLPYTSTITGGRIPISSALPINQLVTGKDDYGNEKPWWETALEALPYYIMPGGYGQAKKTAKGLSMFSDEHPTAGSYTDSGGLRFPVEDTLGNRIKAGVFGQWAFPEARDYIDNERKPLDEKQTQEYIDADMPYADYRNYRDGLSKVNASIRGGKLGRQADYINSLDLPVRTKNLLINNLTDRKDPIDLTDYSNYADFEEFDFAQKNPEKYAFFKEIGVSVKDYNKANEETKRVYTWAYDNPEKYNFIKEQGVSLTDWKHMTDSSKDAYMWAYENPEKHTVAKAVASDVVEYRKYTGDLYDIKADKDKNGKSISGSRKTKVAEYISGLDIDDGAKYILFKSEYPSDDTYNYEIIDYLNRRDDISFEEMNTILTELGFKVTKAGKITWD